MATLTEAEARTRAEAEVRAYCGWHIAPEVTEDVTLDGTGSRILLLRSLKVTDVASVTEDEELVDPGDYQWSASGFLLRLGGACWTDKLRGVVVNLTHGHPSMPMDVEAVIERMTARAVEVSGASQVLSQVGQVAYAVGVDGLRETGTSTQADRFVLDRHRLPFRP